MFSSNKRQTLHGRRFLSKLFGMSKENVAKERTQICAQRIHNESVNLSFLNLFQVNPQVVEERKARARELGPGGKKEGKEEKEVV
jgi:hypothetical protein